MPYDTLCVRRKALKAELWSVKCWTRWKISRVEPPFLILLIYQPNIFGCIWEAFVWLLFEFSCDFGLFDPPFLQPGYDLGCLAVLHEGKWEMIIWPLDGHRSTKTKHQTLESPACIICIPRLEESSDIPYFFFFHVPFATRWSFADHQFSLILCQSEALVPALKPDGQLQFLRAKAGGLVGGMGAFILNGSEWYLPLVFRRFSSCFPRLSVVYWLWFHPNQV